MLQCGDILVFGGTNGFVGIGVGVPHSGGGSNADHESSVAIVCVFPKGTPSSSSIYADGNGGVGVGERSAERKIEDKMFNGRNELYNSSSSTAFPSITNDTEDYSGDIIPVPSSPLTQAGREGLRSDKKRKEIVIEVVGGTQEEIEIEKEIERKKEREIEIEIGVETRKEEDKDKEAPVGSSMAVLRARGHGYNSNITCLATHSLELGRC